MYYVYILRNLNGRHYTGYSEDLNKRLRSHNSNRVRSTKNKGPWEIVYYEAYKTRKEAYLRERQIKQYKGGEAFKKLLMT
ncbi:MAG: GIY-YIG nuclease family protein [bacterium]